jgi:dihydrofolate reductase
MRKLKLQMVVTLDGFGLVPSDKGGTNFVWDDEVTKFCLDNLENVDSIVLGRNTAEGFIPHWAGVANNPADKEYNLGRPLTDIPKVVFSNQPPNGKWNNATTVKGDITTEIAKLKNESGKDMIVYGGYSFVSSLVQNALIDEYYFLVEPLMIGDGQTILKNLKNHMLLKLKRCKSFPCGTVLLHYTKQK